MVTQTLRVEQCTIVEPIEAVAGKYGPQFKFKASVPWTQYPPTFYVNQNLMPEADTAEKRETLLNTDHWAQFKKGQLLKNQDGTEKDSELEWSYRWDIVAWDVKEPEQSAGGGGGGGSLKDRERRSIERQVAFKGAVELAAAQLIDVSEISNFVDIFAGAIADDYITSDELAAGRSPGHILDTLEEDSPLVKVAESLGAVKIDETEAPAEITLECQEHKVPFEYKTSKSGVSKWTHEKADGGWCVYDGGDEILPEPAELPF